METPRNTTNYQVMFFDTDCAGVVHNVAYLRVIEVARTHLAEKLGMGLADMARSQEYPVVVRTEIDYKTPATLGDELVIEGRLERVKGLRFWVAFDVKRASDDALIVQCLQTMAVIKMPGGKPSRLPADWKEKYAHLKE